MARKVVNRKQLRSEAEAAAAAEKENEGSEGGGKKTPVKRKPRAKKVPVEVRMKLFWGVYNQSLKRVALYEYSQKKQAEQKAADLGQNGKSPHFIQKVKEQVTEE